MELKPKIFIYNHGTISHIFNLVIPLLKELISSNIKIELLFKNSETFLPVYFTNSQQKNIVYHIANTRNISHLIQLIKFIKRTKQQKIIVLTENQAIIVGLISKFYRIKNEIVLYKRGALTEERYFITKRRVIKVFYSIIENLAFYSSDRVIFVSNKMYEYYKNKYSINKYYIINHKVFIFNDKIEYNKSLTNKVEIVYCGSAEKWQRIDYIIKLFQSLKSNDSLMFKIICYDSSFFRKFDQSIFKITQTTPENIIQDLSDSDIGIIIRDNNILNQVASPFKIGEYITAGLSVIMTPYIGDYSNMVEREKIGCIISGTNIEQDVRTINNFIKYFIRNRNEMRQKSLKLSKSMFLDYSEHKALLD